MRQLTDEEHDSRRNSQMAEGATTRMPVLSIRQPWAWLIVNGHKDVENREWATRFRGPVLIHAGKTFTRAYYEEVKEDLDFLFADHAPVLPAFDNIERGGVVGMATISDCVQRSDSLWFTGRFGFVLTDQRRLPFHPCAGKLGFFDAEIPASLLRVSTEGWR